MMILNMMKKNIYLIRKVEEPHQKVHQGKNKEVITSTIVNGIILKILAIPVIVVLSTIIFFCKIISLVSWIASKIIIVASIALSAIHGYQIYIGQPIQYKIFVISAVAFVISLFLPSILKIVPSVLGGLNDRLKRFVF